MSYTEFHKGRLKVIAKGDEAIINFTKSNNLEEKFNLDIKDGKIVDHDCYGSGDGAYNILTLFRYQPNEQHILIQYINHFHKDADEYDIDEFNQVGQDEFEFITQFYNGGCCETEIFEDHLEKIDLNKNFEKENEIVTITPRESYMIMDCINYVLNNMIVNGIDYLHCNYSKEELGKLGQRFGDLNLKNQW